MTSQRRPVTGSDAAGAGATVNAIFAGARAGLGASAAALLALLLVGFFIGFFAGVAVVAKRFRHLL